MINPGRLRPTGYVKLTPEAVVEISFCTVGIDEMRRRQIVRRRVVDICGRRAVRRIDDRSNDSMRLDRLGMLQPVDPR